MNKRRKTSSPAWQW